MTQSPDDAIAYFLEEREPEVSAQTQYNNRGHLKRFHTFLSEEGVDQISDLDGFTLRRFKTWLRNNRGVNEVTLGNYVSTIRAFLQWCEKVDLVAEGLFEKMDYPHISDEESSRDTALEPETVDEILSYLYKFEYGTLRHAVFQLMWHATFRLGTVRGLDLGDWNSDRQYLELNHRPESETPLKNKESAQRQVNISGEVADVLDDYITINRHAVEDEYGRKPLFTTKNGRAYDSLLRKHVYAITRPCYYSGDCPHGRNQAECEATNYNKASKCPSSVSPHPIRRSAITKHLNSEWPTELVSERANVSGDVLERHYDVRTEEEKRKNRKRYLNMLQQ